jgi:hypothetical protein
MAKQLYLRFAVLICIMALLTGCTDWDDNEPIGAANPEALITQESSLFELLQRTVNTEDTAPEEQIVCVDFIYPFQLVVYNGDNVAVNTLTMEGDAQFATFLEGLLQEYSVSISYPISTMLDDGTVFTVNNNDELADALNQCINEDIIAGAGSLFSGNGNNCIWFLDYREAINIDNTYAGGFFQANTDGTMHFTYNDITYNGTWTFLLIDNHLQLNIHLEGDSPVAQYWNFSRNVTPGEQYMTLLHASGNIMLSKYCESGTEYQIGQAGPAGGFVFYDKGEYSNGWRYIEAAPTDIPILQWGCPTLSVASAQNTTIGYGMDNSIAIALAHDALNDFYNNPLVCSAESNGTVAARSALLTTTPGDIEHWHLPSQDELLQMYDNLQWNNLGGFVRGSYWSSTEIDEGHALTINFGNGRFDAVSKVSDTIKCRPVRYF